jgi:hypothetical protein
MKYKTHPTIILITLAALLLSACAGNAALGAETAYSEPSTSQTSIEGAQPTVSESVEVTQSAETEAENSTTENDQTEEIIRPTDWGEATHSKQVEPNYEVVFPQNEVNRLDFTIAPENWQTMLADMTSLYGEFGANPRRARPRAGQADPRRQKPPFAGELPPRNEGQAPARDNRPPGGGGMLEGDETNPIWVPVTLEFEGDTWTNVGLRFKGNSSLFSSWGSGNLKLPFKLDFDEFEDDYPEIDDQRFYGFKQLTLSSNFNDSSFLREKVAADIFREAGVPAAQTAFYQVYVNYGEGSVYFGLYTMVEVVDDTLIETQFEDDCGNVYKPSGAGATFAEGSFSKVSFDKETNQDEADYSDILALHQALHTETRTSDPQTWRSDLEAVFDVSGFLQYLAVNTVIQNWDTYGIMQHNYYLYHDPSTDLLTWIPWDNNMTMSASGIKPAASLRLDEVNQQWPLIRYLMDDPVYHEEYVTNVEMVIHGPFNPEMIIARYQELHELIRPYVVGPEGEIEGYTHLHSNETFNAALAELIQHAKSRYQAASEYLDSIR